MASRVYDFTLANLNATQSFAVRGAYVKVLAAPGGAVAVRLDSGEEVELRAGQGFRVLPNSAGQIVPFLGLTVRNLTANPNAGSIFIGDVGFEDSRITGDVSIVDAVNASCATQFLQDLSVATVVQAFVTQAANVRGCIVRASQASAWAGAGGTSVVRFIAALVTPTGPTPGANSIILNSAASFGNAASDRIVNGLFGERRLIPPGWGVFVATTNTVAAAQSAGVLASIEVL